MNKITLLICGLIIFGSTRASSAQTSLFERFRSKTKSESATSTALALLSDDKVAAALKEALSKGVKHAVTQLGQQGGFLTNAAVRIPLPESLEKVEKSLRKFNQDALVDEFITTMNHAAEQAMPQAASIFADSIRQMTIADAKAILSGPEDAATQYFQKTGSTALHEALLPIVQKSTEKAGVTSAYKNLTAMADASALRRSIGNRLFGFGVNPEATDIDGYVTQKAMDGLFKMLAEEEKQIRLNPVARTTDTLKQVFGALRPQ